MERLHLCIHRLLLPFPPPPAAYSVGSVKDECAAQVLEGEARFGADEGKAGVGPHHTITLTPDGLSFTTRFRSRRSQQHSMTIEWVREVVTNRRRSCGI